MGQVTVTRLIVSLFCLSQALMTAVAAPRPMPSPPGIPSASTAQSELADLTVAPQGSQDGYDRDKFPHWITQNGLGILSPLPDACAEVPAEDAIRAMWF